MCLIDCYLPPQVLSSSSFRDKSYPVDIPFPRHLSEPYPRKHETVTQGRFNVGPPSTTLVQHWADIGWLSRVWGMYMWHVITQNSVTEDPDVIKSRGFLESVQRLPGGFLSDMRTDQRVTCAMTGDACVMDQVTTRAPLTGDNGGCLWLCSVWSGVAPCRDDDRLLSWPSWSAQQKKDVKLGSTLSQHCPNISCLM